MTEAPVAVVIPAYQSVGTIGTALASVAGQTVAPAEVVVVDDGSTDGTAQVAKRWSDLLPLKIVEQENGGPAAARRQAVAESAAPLIALLDADDVWLPDHLDAMVRTYERTRGLVSADALPWRPGHPPSLASRRDRKPIPAVERQRIEILRDNFVFVSTMFARADYERVGGFRDGFTGAEDWDLWIRMLRQGLRVYAAPGPTTLYRIVSGSLTRQAAVYDRYIAVLEAARSGCESDEERAVLESRLRWYGVRRQLAIAYDEARRGRGAAARREALRATRGPAKIAVQAAALVVAPRVVTRLGDWMRQRVLG